jgi:hypothetical protein
LEDRNLLSASPIDVVGHLPVTEYNQFIRDAVTFLGNTPYKAWGNEPSIAVNPTNPSQVVISSFAYGFFGPSNASLWVSADGGADWGIRFPISQSPVPNQYVPNDQTIAYDSNGVLHGAFLTFNPFGSSQQFNVFHGATADPNADGVNGRPASVWQWNPNQVNFYHKSNNSGDQPWLALGNGHAYVGYTSYNSAGAGDVQVRVSASGDNGATFTSDNSINSNSNGGLANGNALDPGLRLATDKVGNVYTIYGWNEMPSPKPGEATLLRYRLNMSSDDGQTWKFTNSGGQGGGLDIDDGLSLQLGSSFGGVNRLTGNITAIAADPTGAHVYAVYGKEDAAGTDRLYLGEFHPDGAGNLVERASPLPFSVVGQRSALPSIAVTDNGGVAVQYDTFNSADGQFHVHLATSTDQGQSFKDQDIYDFTPTGLPVQITDRLLGDYQGLIAVGNSVYGTFAARGNVVNARTAIDTTGMIVPFFYSATLPNGRLASLAPSSAGNLTPLVGSAGMEASGPRGDAARLIQSAMDGPWNGQLGSPPSLFQVAIAAVGTASSPQTGDFSFVGTVLRASTGSFQPTQNSGSVDGRQVGLNAFVAFSSPAVDFSNESAGLLNSGQGQSDPLTHLTFLDQDEFWSSVAWPALLQQIPDMTGRFGR